MTKSEIDLSEDKSDNGRNEHNSNHFYGKNKYSPK